MTPERGRDSMNALKMLALAAVLVLPGLAPAQQRYTMLSPPTPPPQKTTTQVQLFGFQRSCRPQQAPAPAPPQIVIPQQQQQTDPVLAGMLGQVLANQTQIIAMLQRQPLQAAPTPAPVAPPMAANPGPLVLQAPQAPIVLQSPGPQVIGGGAPFQQLSPQGAPYQYLQPQGAPQQYLNPAGPPVQILIPQGQPQQQLAPQGQAPQHLAPGAPPVQRLAPDLIPQLPGSGIVPPAFAPQVPPALPAPVAPPTQRLLPQGGQPLQPLSPARYAYPTTTLRTIVQR